MALNGVMVVTLRYFTEFGKPAFQRITAATRKKESSRSLSRLLMNFLSQLAYADTTVDWHRCAAPLPSN